MGFEPVALAFANTRSSSRRDRIATVSDWRTWIDAWPGLHAVGRRVDAEGLIGLRGLRDDVQSLLHSSASVEGPDAAALARVVELAGSEPSHGIRWTSDRPVLFVAEHAPPDLGLALHLARAAVDLLLAGPSLTRCAGRDCRKLFVATRTDRRWCDSTVCGNRARVRAYGDRRRKAASRQ